jgi:protein FRA10AC1
MDNSLPIKTDKDTLREGYRSEPCAVNVCLCFLGNSEKPQCLTYLLLLLCERFILSEDDDMDSTWEKRLVKRYYDKLFKEYPVLVNFILHCSSYDDMSVHGIRFR